MPAAAVEISENPVFHTVTDKISESENPLLEVTYTDKENALTLLKEQKVKGIIWLDEDISLSVASDSIEATILESFLNQYKRQENYETKDYVLTIKKGFSENLSDGKTEGLFDNRYVHESYSNVLMTNLADEYVKTVRAFLAKGDDLSTAQKNTADTLSLNVEVTKETFKEEHIYSDDYSALFSAYFQYLPYVFLQILVSALCPVLLTMNKKNIRNRTNCSSLRPSSQTFQIFLGSMIFVLGLWLLFMISGALLNEEFYKGRALLAVLNSFVFIIISTGIAILIASFNPGRVGVNILSNIISLGMCFLCGIFVPQEVLSDNVLSAARFLPAYWYIRVNNMLSGVSGEIFSSSLCMKFIGIEVLFALAIFAAALTVTKIRHDKA